MSTAPLTSGEALVPVLFWTGNRKWPQSKIGEVVGEGGLWCVFFFSCLVLVFENFFSPTGLFEIIWVLCRNFVPSVSHRHDTHTQWKWVADNRQFFTPLDDVTEGWTNLQPHLTFFPASLSPLPGKPLEQQTVFKLEIYNTLKWTEDAVVERLSQQV